MSWSTSTPNPVSREPFAFDGANIQPPNPNGHAPDETLEQFKGALKAAQVLAYFVGRPEDDISVSLSGHANVNHAPEGNWANEVITITVAAVPKGK